MTFLLLFFRFLQNVERVSGQGWMFGVAFFDRHSFEIGIDHAEPAKLIWISGAVGEVWFSGSILMIMIARFHNRWACAGSCID